MKPIVTLTIDDCVKDDALGFASVVEENSLTAVFYIIAGLAGSALNGLQLLDWEGVRSISRKGHEIGSHSLTHRGAELGMLGKASRFAHQMRNDSVSRTIRRTLTVAKSKDEFPDAHRGHREEALESKELIEKQISKTCKSYSYPGGGYTSSIKEIVRTSGYHSARTGLTGFNNLGKQDPFALKVKSWDVNVSAEEANRWLDEAIEKNLWLIEVYHALDRPSYLYSASRLAIDAHLRYVRARLKEVENLTVSEVIV